ncbi:tail fiber domain-containing protein [Candidatus Peregrinibacteria bacterium]|nr:MAG: tail fiber domain-containing protein [Candidatus Peregrinibacteria bacterium]
MKTKFLFSIFLAFALLSTVFLDGVRQGALAVVDWPDAPSGYASWGKIGDILFPDLGNQRLGIGTGTPLGRFHVVGGGKRVTMTADSINGDGTNNCSAGQEKVFLDATGISIGDTIEGNTIMSVGGGYVCTNQNSVSWKNGEEKWWKKNGTDVLISDTGRVGIGTVSPQNRLDVEGGAVIGTNYSGTETAPANGLLVQGNVGIGTASPTEKLVVDGNVRITNGSDICIEGGNCLSSVEGVSDNDWTVVGGGTQTDSCHAYQTYSSPYCTLTATNIGGGNYRLNYTIDFQNSGWWSRADATYGKIYPDDIRIDKTAAQQSGSVVVTPSQREIYWFRFPGGTVASPSPDPIICSIPAPIGGSASAPGICGSAHESTFSSTPTANLCSSGTATAITTGAYTDASYYWQCAEQQTETMYSGVSGNVGIGTASPNAKLHVKTDTGTNAEIDIQSGELTHWGMYQDENTSDLQFWNTDNRVTFTNDGKVGIGTTSPTQALDVNGRIKGTELCIAGACRSSWPSGASWGSITGSLSSQSDLNTALNQRLSLSGGTMTGQLLLSGNPTSALGAATKQYVDGAVSAVSLKEIHDADNNTKVQVEESTNENKIRFDTNGTERMIIDNSGNVGIGTTSPLGKLHIYNPANTGAELILETISSAQAAAIRFYADGIYSGNIGYLPGLDGMGIGGGNEQASSIFVQRNTQDVGIGTTSPLGKLHIYNPVNTGAELIVDSISTGITAIQLYSGGVSKGSISYNPAVGANTISLGSDTNGNVINILRTNNYVGIGTISPAYQLDVNGYIRGTNVAPSDIRLKKDIVTLSDSLSKILHLRGVSYFWKDSEKGEEKQIGVIAQEVEKEFPELVLEDNEGMKSVNYSALVAPLIEAVKEQQKEIEAQKENIDAQEQEIEMLSSEIQEIRSLLQTSSNQ